jgi:hypothetical protein
MNAPRTSQSLSVAAHAARQRESGHVRTNVVLAPDDLARLGRLMAAWGVSRQEAMRRAIDAAHSALSDQGAD